MGKRMYPTPMFTLCEVTQESGFRPIRRQGISALVGWRACTLATLATS